jgi:hypothetical protein
MAPVRLLPVGLLILAALASGCPSAEPDPPPSSPAIDPWRRDSGAYEAALAIWLRDSAVVDSVSRTVDTDSLYRLYRRLLTDPNPAPLVQEIACEEWRLRRRYKPLPFEAAERRMLDTVWLPHETDAVRQVNARLSGIDEPTADRWTCGGEVERVVPEVVSGAPMSMGTVRPVPPRRQRP